MPDDAVYPFSMEPFFRKNARLSSGANPRRARREALAKARVYLQAHPDLGQRYVTNVLEPSQVNEAFRLAASPARGQIKIVLSD